MTGVCLRCAHRAQKSQAPLPPPRGGSSGHVTAVSAVPSLMPSPNSWLWVHMSLSFNSFSPSPYPPAIKVKMLHDAIKIAADLRSERMHLSEEWVEVSSACTTQLKKFRAYLVFSTPCFFMIFLLDVSIIQCFWTSQSTICISSSIFDVICE